MSLVVLEKPCEAFLDVSVLELQGSHVCWYMSLAQSLLLSWLTLGKLFL